MPEQLRYKRIKVCKECGYKCDDRTVCEPARQKLRNYSGIRFTSDGFDCALPVTIDSFSHCSYGCLFCFADNLLEHRKQAERKLGVTSLKRIEAFFSGKPGKSYDLWRRALKYDDSEHEYPCPIQLGAICDPCDHIERNQGWLLEFMELAIKYRQPVRMSTRGTVLQFKDYLDVISKAPELFWIAFSIITPDDDLAARVEIRAPSPTERLKTMKQLSDIGVKTSLRFRPMMAGLSDATPKYPKAYRVLIEKAAEAGAVAVSAEVGFVPGAMTEDLKDRWIKLERAAGVPFVRLYSKFGKKQACTRPPHSWTENIMHAVRNVSHECRLVLGISDPVWKQLTDTGCCCGILPDDPVFGNWQQESATNRLLEAKLEGSGQIHATDIVPEWAYDARLAGLVHPGVGPVAAYRHRHDRWSDCLLKIWNNPGKERSALNYFQGALVPIERSEDGHLIYEYRGLKRKYPEKTPFWSVDPADAHPDSPQLTEYRT